MNAEKNISDFTSEFQEKTQKSIGERIRQLWISSGEQQDEFVKSLGISTVTLSNYMNGKRKPDSEFLFAIKKKLNIRLDWLLAGDGPMRPVEESRQEPSPLVERTCECDVDLIMIPRVAARLAAGTGSLETDGDVRGHYAFRSDWIRRKGNVSQMVLMDVTGDSMLPKIENGDMVLVDQGHTRITAYGIYAVGVEDAVYVKQLRTRPGQLILHSLNPDYEDIVVDTATDQPESVRIIGRVLWVGRELA